MWNKLAALVLAVPFLVTAGTPPSSAAAPVLAPALSTNFTGSSDNLNFIPPDTMGAVGPSHLMETLNGTVTYFNKSSGAQISSGTLNAFWTNRPLGLTTFDPKVVYDQHSSRFIVVSLAGTSTVNSTVLVGVSATSDPTGTWSLYSFSGVESGTWWSDYPGLGVDANNVYLSFNMFTNGDSFDHSRIHVIPKTQTFLSGGGATVTTFSTSQLSLLTAFTFQPAHVFGSTSFEYLVSAETAGTLRVIKISSTQTSPTIADAGTVSVTSFPSAVPDATQKGVSTTIETNDNRLLNAVLRNGHLWTTHTVSNTAGTKTEVAWYEIDPTAPSVVQQGRVSDASLNYYYPSIAVSSSNDALLGFSGSDANTYASAYYTARASGDPSGTMQTVATLQAGLGPYIKTFGSGRNRWGDFSATMVDPSDDATFWTLQEYAATPSGTGMTDGQGRWGTWWGQSSVPFNYSFALDNSSITLVAGNSASVTLTATLTGGTGQDVTLSVSGCPSAATCTLSASTVTPTTAGAPTTLTVATTSCMLAETATLTISGSGGSVSKSVSASLTVSAAAPCGTSSGGGCAIDPTAEFDPTLPTLLALALLSLLAHRLRQRRASWPKRARSGGQS